MNKSLLIFPAIVGSVLLSGCHEYVDGSVYVHRTGYVEPAYDTDFYYVSSRPYSHYYGPLYMRGDRYYYSRGGSYYVYDRPTVHNRTVVRTRGERVADRRYRRVERREVVY